jgi:hypothetical protein
MDIFIKTYHLDFQYLEYLLKSIKVFCKGFRNVIIVTDSGKDFPDDLKNIIPIKLFYIEMPNSFSHNIEYGVGYLWQQYIKLSWYKYTDAEYVLVMDSDQMFTQPTTPEKFMRKKKYTWYFERWISPDIKWKSSTEKLLKYEVGNSAMCFPGFIFKRNITLEFLKYINTKHKIWNFWDLVIRDNIEMFSEYNLYGSFMERFYYDEYYCIYNSKTCFNDRIIQDISKEELTLERRAERDKILSVK